VIKKALKYTVYTLIVLVVLLVAAAVAVSKFVDPNAFKPDIERAAKEATQRTLKLEGNLGLAFFPSLGVTLGRATLSERASNREFASLEAGKVSVALIPLLRREIVVDEVRITGLKANIVRGKDGRLNIEDLAGAGAAAAEAPPAGKPAPRPAAPAVAGRPAVRIDISGLRIDHAALSYHDERSGQTFEVSDLDLRTGRIASDTPGTLHVSAVLRGKKPAIDLKTELGGDYRFNLEKSTFALNGLDAKVSGAAAGVSDLAVALKGSVAADAARGKFGVRSLALDARGRLGEQSFETTLSSPALALDAGTASGETVQADAKLTAPSRSVTAHAKATGLRGSAKQVSIRDLALDFDAREGDLSAKGKLTTALEAGVAAGRYELARLGGTVSAKLPALPGKTLEVSFKGAAQADLPAERVAGELTAKLDDTNLKAKFGMEKFAAPRYTFDVAIDRLDVDRYLPPSGGAAGAAAPAKAGAEADTPIDFSPLRDLAADGRLRVGALTAHRVKATDIELPLHVAGGRLESGPQRAKLYGGTLAGALTLDAKGNHVAVKEDLRGVAIGPLVKVLLQRDAAEGRGDVALDLTAAGASVNAMKRSLAGTARVSFKNGALKGINLTETLRRTRAALGSKSAASQPADPSQKTEFGDLSASFRVKNGVAHNDDLKAVSPFYHVTGAGDIDIGASRVDYKVKAAVVKGAPGLGELAGLTVPVKVSGPFDALKYEIQYGELVREKAKQRIIERLGGKPGESAAEAAREKAKQKAEEKLKEKLRGLFRR